MTDMLSARICAHIAEEIAARSSQVEAAVRLLDEGATVPFIARYRKEMTGGLTDAQLRTLEERLVYLRELNDRRETILASTEAQGKLDDALKERLLKAETKQELEDLYAPYKSKRRTRAAIAKEAGLEPLAGRWILFVRRLPSSMPKRVLPMRRQRLMAQETFLQNASASMQS